jgi:membrane-associated phospholipid phosphatase
MDLAENFTGLVASENLVPLLVGTASTFAAMPIQNRTKTFFDNQHRWRGFDSLGKEAGKSQYIGPAIGVSFLLSRTTKNTKAKKFTYSLAQGFIVSNVVYGSVKKMVGRQRPDDTNHVSFPSGHTANAFMVASVASHHYGWKAGLPAYAFATYIGSSRLKSRKHFLTDVVAGATLGYIVGRTVTRRDRKNRERRINWGISVPPGGGAALGMGVRLGRR